MKRTISILVVCSLAVLCIGTTSDSSNLEDLLAKFGFTSFGALRALSSWDTAHERLGEDKEHVSDRYPVIWDRLLRDSKWREGLNNFTWTELFREVLECSLSTNSQLGVDLTALYARVDALEIEVDALRTEVAALRAAGPTIEYQFPASSGSSSECIDDVVDWAENEFDRIFNILNDLEDRIYDLERNSW